MPENVIEALSEVWGLFRFPINRNSMKRIRPGWWQVAYTAYASVIWVFGILPMLLLWLPFLATSACFALPGWLLTNAAQWALVPVAFLHIWIDRDSRHGLLSPLAPVTVRFKRAATLLSALAEDDRRADLWRRATLAKHGGSDE